MKIDFNFGRRVTVLPSLVYEKLDSATKNDIKVLFILAGADRDVDPEALSVEELAERTGLKVKQVGDALRFWEKAGVIAMADDMPALEETRKEISESQKEEEKPRVLVRRSDEMPSYTTDEIAKVLANRKDTSYLLDECQQELGKIFSTHDLNIMVGMLDYLGVDTGYIVTLLKHCNKIGKRTMRYAEKLAFALVEEGIDNTPALKIKLAELEALKKNESAVRKLFGMKSRTITAKEKACMTLWFGKFGFAMDMVECAYEIAVNNINEPSVAYTHAILERWNSEGIRTPEDVRRSIDERKAANAQEPDGSFDTDDFFEAALKRSYKEYEKA